MDHPIKSYRKFLGVTQGQFALMIGVSGAYVSFWESGSRPVRHEHAIKIASALQKPIDEVERDLRLWLKNKKTELQQRSKHKISLQKTDPQQATA